MKASAPASSLKPSAINWAMGVSGRRCYGQLAERVHPLSAVLPPGVATVGWTPDGSSSR